MNQWVRLQDKLRSLAENSEDRDHRTVYDGLHYACMSRKMPPDIELVMTGLDHDGLTRLCEDIIGCCQGYVAPDAWHWAEYLLDPNNPYKESEQ